MEKEYYIHCLMTIQKTVTERVEKYMSEVKEIRKELSGTTRNKENEDKWIKLLDVSSRLSEILFIETIVRQNWNKMEKDTPETEG